MKNTAHFHLRNYGNFPLKLSKKEKKTNSETYDFIAARKPNISSLLTKHSHEIKSKPCKNSKIVRTYF